MNEQKLDIREGTISFWIKKRTINYNDGKANVLLNPSTNDKVKNTKEDK